MKLIIRLLIIFALTLALVSTGNAQVSEKDLSHEAAPKDNNNGPPESSLLFEGYANSRDVTIVGGVMSCVYYFCKDNKSEFCSDFEGVLIVTGAETGKIPRIIKTLDEALSNSTKLLIRLSSEKQFSGIKMILDTKPIQGSI